MAAIANVTLSDAAGTPVVHTFTPTRVGVEGANLKALWHDRSANAGVSAGFFTLDMSYSAPSKDRKSYRLGLKLSTPVLEVLSNSTVTGIEPAPTVSHVPLVQIDFVLPERATLQNRKDLLAMVRELIDETIVTNLVESLEPVY